MTSAGMTEERQEQPALWSPGTAAFRFVGFVDLLRLIGKLYLAL